MQQTRTFQCAAFRVNSGCHFAEFRFPFCLWGSDLGWASGQVGEGRAGEGQSGVTQWFKKSGIGASYAKFNECIYSIHEVTSVCCVAALA